MNTSELCEALAVGQEKVNEWIAAGLPHNPGDGGPLFDAAEIAAWLSERGIIERREVLPTLAAVGIRFGVSERTAAAWRAKGMPGEPGAYDVDQIITWLESTGLGPARAVGGPADTDPTRAEAERRRALAEAERAELRVATLRGELVEVEDVIRIVLHHATHARALFEQVPMRLEGLLPAAGQRMTQDDRRRFRREADKAIQTVCQALCDELEREMGTMHATARAAGARLPDLDGLAAESTAAVPAPAETVPGDPAAPPATPDHPTP